MSLQLAKQSIIAIAFVISSVATAHSEADNLIVAGMHLSMTTDDLKESLSSKGLQCDEDQKLFQPPTIPLEEIVTKRIIFCFDSPESDSVTSLKRRLLSVGPPMMDFLLSGYEKSGRQKRLMPDFQGSLDNIRILNASRETLHILKDMARLYQIAIIHEVRGSPSLILSCAMFNACNRPLGEIRDNLRSDIIFDRYEAVPGRPLVLSYIYHDIMRIFEDDENFDSVRKYTTSESLNFETGLMGCVFMGPDRFCLYDEAITLDALGLMLAADNLPTNPDAISFLRNIRIPARLFLFQRDPDFGSGLSFR